MFQSTCRDPHAIPPTRSKIPTSNFEALKSHQCCLYCPGLWLPLSCGFDNACPILLPIRKLLRALAPRQNTLPLITLEESRCRHCQPPSCHVLQTQEREDKTAATSIDPWFRSKLREFLGVQAAPSEWTFTHLIWLISLALRLTLSSHSNNQAITKQPPRHQTNSSLI